MKKIFISYADDKMRYSLKRIGWQARKLGLFDNVILYTPDMLPEYIKTSPLMKYQRGGGYWAWKPAIIWETLQKFDENTIVVFTDAGCTLKKSPDWDYYFSQMASYDTILFQYKDEMPTWKQWGQISTQIRFWTKQKTYQYFRELLGYDYGDSKKCLGGVIFSKNTNNQFIKHWLDITLQHPELVIDPMEKEINEQPATLAYHKHDQSIITPLACLYSSEVLALPETIETNTEKAAIVASRIRARTFWDYIVLQTKYYLRKWLGDNLFERIKKLIKK